MQRTREIAAVVGRNGDERRVEDRGDGAAVHAATRVHRVLEELY